MTAILEKRERRGQAGRQALVNARVTDSSVSPHTPFAFRDPSQTARRP